MRLRLLGVACALLAASGCGGPAAPGEAPEDAVRAAPTSAVLAGKTLVLSAYLWRDFQPISPPDGKALAGVFRVGTADGSAMPTGVKADAVWLVMANQLWSGTPMESGAPDGTSPIYELSVRDGPKWGPGVAVDAVIRLADAGGRAVLLRAAGQIIQRTD